MPTFLTDAVIRKALKDRSKRIVLLDAGERGLRLTVGKRDAVYSFVTTVREGDERREVFHRIGRIEEISVAEARAEAAKWKTAIRNGVDPKAERRAAEARRTTLGKEAAGWVPRGGERSRINDRGDLRLVLRELQMEDAAPSELIKADCMRLLKMHRDKSSVARSRLGALRRFLDHLLDEGIIERNPARDLPRRAIPPAPPSRSRYPSALELQKLWQAAEKLPQARFHDLFRILILCPLRRNEAASLQASDIDLHRREIRLAASKMKARRDFTMPLSDAAFDLLKPYIDAASAPDQPLFGGAVSWSRQIGRLRRISGVAFAPHDFRRLFVTECAEHKVGDVDLLDGLLAHSASASRGGILGIYQRSSRAEERRAVMERWSAIVAVAVEKGLWPREIENKKKVVDIRRGRA